MRAGIRETCRFRVGARCYALTPSGYEMGPGYEEVSPDWAGDIVRRAAFDEPMVIVLFMADFLRVRALPHHARTRAEWGEAFARELEAWRRSFVLWREKPAAMGWGRRRPTERAPTVEPKDSGGPTKVEEETWYEVRLVDEVGEPIAGVVMSVADSPPLTTDVDGRIRYELASTGVGLARVRDVDGLRNAIKPRWEQVREGAWLTEADGHCYLGCANEMPMVQVYKETPHTIVVQPRVVRARILDLLFDTNKTFLLPPALERIRAVRTLYDEHPKAKVLIVGHTDASGEPEVNDRLSLARAGSVKAFLTDDVDAWLAFYENDVHPKARWGDTEDQLMLRAVLSASGEVPQGDPLVHFQSTRGLPQDATFNTATRRALITEYMATDGTSLPAGIDPIVHGCGENFPRERAEDEGEAESAAEPIDAESEAQRLDRRVELFFFDAKLGVLPPPPGENSPASSTVYPEWCRRAKETHDFNVRAHSQTVRILLASGGMERDVLAERPGSFMLRTSDGMYESVLSFGDIEPVSPYHYELRFEGAPVDARFVLSHDPHAESTFEIVLLDDAVIEDLHESCGEGKMCTEPDGPPSPDEKPEYDPHPDATGPALEDQGALHYL